jgi:hypothetical protein
LSAHALLHPAYEKDARKRTHDHDSLQRDIGHAASFRKNAAQCHDQQRDRKKHRLLDKQEKNIHK